MSVHEVLSRRQEHGDPIRVGIIGAGRYGAMYLAQSRFIPGVQIVGVADLDLAKAETILARAGWGDDAVAQAKSAGQINDFSKRGKTALTDDSQHLIEADVDVIVEITGSVEAATRHAWNAMDAGKHVVMVTTEADALVGVALQKKAEQAGVVYSFGYGDEPAEMCELIDWARTSGFSVACVGKYLEYVPEKRYVTPDTVWNYKTNYTKEQIESGELNAKLYSSFVDGTKTILEACCAANASGLVPPKGGMRFPTLEYFDMPSMLRPKEDGGILDGFGMIEIPTNFHRDGTPVKDHLRWGVFISVRAESDYAAGFLRDFRDENRVKVDDSGRYAIMYRPTHVLGLELNISIASVALNGLATGHPESFMADMVAVAKRDLRAGEMLDEPGAFTNYGDCVPAKESVAGRYLPTGLCSDQVKVVRSVAKDAVLTYDDVQIDESLFSYKLRRQIEDGLT